MARASSFRDLVVWQRAMTVASMAYGFTKYWPAEHRFGIASQIQRSAVSVPSNIAEGYERRSRLDYLRFLAIAAGSLAELETQVRLAARIGLSTGLSQPLIDRIHEVARIIRGIERALKATRTSKAIKQPRSIAVPATKAASRRSTARQHNEDRAAEIPSAPNVSISRALSPKPEEPRPC